MGIERITSYSDELLQAMNMLIPQLSSSTPEMTQQQLTDLLAQDGMYLFIYRSDQADNPTQDGVTSNQNSATSTDTQRSYANSTPNNQAPIVGMLSLATFTIPTGTRAWIEDVVVDDAARGQGAGQKLVEAAITYAQEIGAKSVDLTSRPSREAANRLYQRCGFVLRQTNVYRYQG